MIAKEKIIFWPLLVIFIGILVFGLGSQGRKKQATEELSKDIEMATKKAMAKKKSDRQTWDIEAAKAVDTLDSYNTLIKRSPFFRIRPKEEIKKSEPIPVKEEPKKPVFKYKGRVMMGQNVMVIIEDQGTGKSSFVKEGDMVGDYMVLSIDESQVVLKQKGGEKVVLSAMKTEKEKTEGAKEDLKKEKTE